MVSIPAWCGRHHCLGLVFWVGRLSRVLHWAPLSGFGWVSLLDFDWMSLLGFGLSVSLEFWLEHLSQVLGWASLLSFGLSVSLEFWVEYLSWILGRASFSGFGWASLSGFAFGVSLGTTKVPSMRCVNRPRAELEWFRCRSAQPGREIQVNQELLGETEAAGDFSCPQQSTAELWIKIDVG